MFTLLRKCMASKWCLSNKGNTLSWKGRFFNPLMTKLFQRVNGVALIKHVLNCCRHHVFKQEVQGLNVFAIKVSASLFLASVKLRFSSWKSQWLQCNNEPKTVVWQRWQIRENQNRHLLYEMFLIPSVYTKTRWPSRDKIFSFFFRRCQLLLWPVFKVEVKTLWFVFSNWCFHAPFIHFGKVVTNYDTKT